jgi:hypothetical protein
VKPYERINFYPRSRSIWLPAAIAAALFLGACGLLFGAWRMDGKHRQLQEQRADRDFQRQLRERKFALYAERQDQRLRALDKLVEPSIQATAFPWDELLLSLERLKAPGVRVMSLSVDSRQGIARLNIECADAVQATEVIDWLEAANPQGIRRWRLGRMQGKPEAATKFEAELTFSPSHRP